MPSKSLRTDNGSEFRSKHFGSAVEACGATQRRIKAGRQNSNGYAERVQLTILEECWRPAFSRSLARIGDEMATAGHGARGIIFGSRGPGQLGHFFNVVNQGETVRFLDGQSGGAADLEDGFKSF